MQLAFGKSSALAQRPRLPKSSSSIEFGPWILITLHCAGNESQWSQRFYFLLICDDALDAD